MPPAFIDPPTCWQARNRPNYSACNCRITRPTPRWAKKTGFMHEDFQFRYSSRGLPPPGAEALTFAEIEQEFLKTLDARGGKCPDSLGGLAWLYQKTGYFDKASACIQRIIDLADDPDVADAGQLALGQLDKSRGESKAAAQRDRGAT